MGIKIKHEITLESGVVVSYEPGRGVEVRRNNQVYSRGVDGSGVYQVLGRGRRVKMGDSWLQADPELSDAVFTARRALVAAIEELTA